jgi:predicted nucleic acid-binding protein
LNVIYFETSALLAWLLGEPCGAEVKTRIDSAETVVTSVLTLVEAERALVRAEIRNMLNAGEAEKLRGMLARSKAGWVLMEISEDVRRRASQFFPAEPARTLDAIHLATALVFMRVFPDLELVSYDQRIIKNAQVLGIRTTMDA